MADRNLTDRQKDPKIVYADIIGLPHHQAPDRPHMPLSERAAQFAPFAALVGYEDMIHEEGRLTEVMTPLTDEDTMLLNQKLNRIARAIADRQYPEISVVYFEPDPHKDGGSYETFTGTVKKINAVKGILIFSEKNIFINRIREISGDPAAIID